jgi:hypothetical protein
VQHCDCEADYIQGIYIKNILYGKKLLPLKGVRYKNVFMYGYFAEQRLQMHQSVFCARNDAYCKSKI